MVGRGCLAVGSSLQELITIKDSLRYALLKVWAVAGSVESSSFARRSLRMVGSTQ